MELKRLVQSSSSTSPGRHLHHQLLLKKLVAAYQTAVQGLQVTREPFTSCSLSSSEFQSMHCSESTGMSQSAARFASGHGDSQQAGSTFVLPLRVDIAEIADKPTLVFEWIRSAPGRCKIKIYSTVSFHASHFFLFCFL